MQEWTEEQLSALHKICEIAASVGLVVSRMNEDGDLEPGLDLSIREKEEGTIYFDDCEGLSIRKTGYYP